MYGYSATGSCTMATTQTITMRMEITMATIGRSMKNLAIGGGLLPRAAFGGLARRQPDLLAGAHPVASLHDDPLAGLEPLGDDPERADARVDLHPAHVHGLVRPDHRNLVDPLHVLNGPLGDHEGVLPHLDDGPDLRVLAGAQHVSRIREHAAREHGTGGDVDLPIQGGGPPSCRIDAPVGQDQLQLDVPG